MFVSMAAPIGFAAMHRFSLRNAFYRIPFSRSMAARPSYAVLGTSFSFSAASDVFSAAFAALGYPHGSYRHIPILASAAGFSIFVGSISLAVRILEPTAVSAPSDRFSANIADGAVASSFEPRSRLAARKRGAFASLYPQTEIVSRTI